MSWHHGDNPAAARLNFDGTGCLFIIQLMVNMGAESAVLWGVGIGGQILYFTPADGGS